MADTAHAAAQPAGAPAIKSASVSKVASSTTLPSSPTTQMAICRQTHQDLQKNSMTRILRLCFTGAMVAPLAGKSARSRRHQVLAIYGGNHFIFRTVVTDDSHIPPSSKTGMSVEKGSKSTAILFSDPCVCCSQRT
jgi:hypothetical protein